MSCPAGREVAIRKRIASIYNKRPEDFTSMVEYNNYLEETEDIVFNLVEGIDVEATEKRVTQYKRENEDQIAATQARKAEEERLVAVGVGIDTPSSKGLFDERAFASAGEAKHGSTIYIGAPEDENDPEAKKKRRELELYASGYVEEWCRQRAIHEAHTCLF